VKTACFVAQSDRLGKRKIIIAGNSTRQVMREHLRIAYIGATDNCCLQPPTLPTEEKPRDGSLTGEYIFRLVGIDETNTPDRGVTERIHVRRAAFWERII
jgi:hypothetical protein